MSRYNCARGVLCLLIANSICVLLSLVVGISISNRGAYSAFVVIPACARSLSRTFTTMSCYPQGLGR